MVIGIKNLTTGVAIADGTTVTFYAAADTGLASVLDTQVTAAGQVSSSILALNTAYVAVIAGVVVPFNSSYSPFTIPLELFAAPTATSAGWAPNQFLFNENVTINAASVATVSAVPKICQTGSKATVLTGGRTSKVTYTSGTGKLTVALGTLPVGADTWVVKVDGLMKVDMAASSAFAGGCILYPGSATAAADVGSTSYSPSFLVTSAANYAVQSDALFLLDGSLTSADLAFQSNPSPAQTTNNTVIQVCITVAACKLK